MRLKYVLKRPLESDSEVIVERSTPEYPVPSVDDRVRIGGEFYQVWRVFHAFDAEDDAFDDPDEVHALVVPHDEAVESIDSRLTG